MGIWEVKFFVNKQPQQQQQQHSNHNNDNIHNQHCSMHEPGLPDVPVLVQEVHDGVHPRDDEGDDGEPDAGEAERRAAEEAERPHPGAAVWVAQCAAARRRLLLVEMYAGWAMVSEGMRGADDLDREAFENEDEWPVIAREWWGPRRVQHHLDYS